MRIEPKRVMFELNSNFLKIEIDIITVPASIKALSQPLKRKGSCPNKLKIEIRKGHMGGQLISDDPSNEIKEADLMKFSDAEMY